MGGGAELLMTRAPFICPAKEKKKERKGGREGVRREGSALTRVSLAVTRTTRRRKVTTLKRQRSRQRLRRVKLFLNHPE